MGKRKRKPGGGRKPAAQERPIERNRSFYLFKDQVERVTPDFVRAAVDGALSARRFEFGEGDWLEIRRESHHPYGMAFVSGTGKARKAWEKVGLRPYEECIQILEQESRPE